MLICVGGAIGILGRSFGSQLGPHLLKEKERLCRLKWWARLSVLSKVVRASKVPSRAVCGEIILTELSFGSWHYLLEGYGMRRACLCV